MGATLCRTLPPRGGALAIRPPLTTLKKIPTTRIPYQEEDDDDEALRESLPCFAEEWIRTLAREEDAIPGELVDPIMLTKIPPGEPLFVFVRPNGAEITYRAETLIEFCKSAGKFFEPESRIEFSREDLVKLDGIGAGLGLPSLVEAKEAGGMEVEDAFDGVERLAGESVSEMIRVIERTKKTNVEGAEVELLTRVFLNWRYYVALMNDINPDATAVAVDQYRIFLRGPPNRPTKDRSRGGLVLFCENYMNDTMNELWTANENRL